MTVQQQLKQAKSVCSALTAISDATRLQVLNAVADAIYTRKESILEANSRDLDRMNPENPRYDRLLLNTERLEGIATDVRHVANSPSPLDIELEARTLDNGLQLERISVPIGVVGIVYEARPNVTFDVFALCFRSGNCCVLKGGSDAAESNCAIVELIQEILRAHNCPPDAIQLLSPTRRAVEELLSAVDTVDVVIPRGSKALIDYVRETAKVPVIETGAGVVHTYIDKDVDLDAAQNVILNAKTRRVSVCNALDTLLIHTDQLDALPQLLTPLAHHKVELFADTLSHEVLRNRYPEALLKRATDDHYGIEFLDYKLAIRCVNTLDDALNHIAQHSSRHSEAILSTNPMAIEKFLQSVDAAVIYSNASTAFTDGAQFGLGAEIGISTQKLPPRGPMALRDITTYKWIVRGAGHVRS
ncbi:Gamma-glutamyl phosphate reductase [Chlamydiales bacterium SCGC AG-110-P3]|nr:Gamma-glutamyl phosphate reductase [Chlamydiales bacterium SCGC AG-110-P3]